MAHITITPAGKTVTISAGEDIIATSAKALLLTEGAYPPVFYVPKADIDMTRLSKTPTATHCPHKGDATYWSLRAGDETIADAGWSYDAPFDAVSEIKNHIAFYASKVTVEAA